MWRLGRVLPLHSPASSGAAWSGLWNALAGRISKQRVAAVAAPPRQEPASSAGAARTGTVLLVESPAKAKKIQQYLGDQYTARPCPRALRSCF